MKNETYICVDVVTAGPIPGQFALLSIGACLVENPSTSFYVELKPDYDEVSAETMATHSLSMDQLLKTGALPFEAMQSFADWIHQVTPVKNHPVFVALNAPFDWMFINDYFYRYLGFNPFGQNTLDLKTCFMGKTGPELGQTSLNHIPSCFVEESRHTHHALADAQDQAEIFGMILK